MKVALCLFGQPRFMDLSGVNIQYNDEIISRYGADVYAHAWKGSSASLDVPSWARNHGMTDPNLPVDVRESLLKHYNPKRWIIQHPIQRNLSDADMVQYLHQKFEGNEFWSEHNMRNIVSQCYSIGRVIELVEGDYDFHVLARYDTRLTGFPDLTRLDPDKSYLPEGGHWNDLIQIWSKRHINHLRELHWAIREPEVYENVLLPIPEFFKMEAFRLFYETNEMANVLRLPMYGHVIRRKEDI